MSTAKPRGRTDAFFDSYAADFSAIYGTGNSFINRFINSRFRRSMVLRFAKSIAGCRPVEGRSVLDVGCGPGHYSITLAKQGAARIVGLDFAPAMIALAKQQAAAAGVSSTCEFLCTDFMTFSAPQGFDYAIVMGFMDYVSDPAAVVQKVLALTRRKAFFSFPRHGGLLAWQRKLRYRRRCDLYLYRLDEIEELFKRVGDAQATIERIERDFFVTASK
ncbi:MAG TPA: class I SAM-dependent methyltransferase [bacterium]|nr:class I SAM-dependent methyltransferase [bacterium]